MTRDELIKYNEETIECLSHIENNSCDCNCEKCHINTRIDVFEISRKTIEYLKDSVKLSDKERDVLTWLIQKEIVNEKLHSNQESEKYILLSGLIEKLRM